MAEFCSQLHSATQTEHERSNKLINLKLLIVATDKELWRNAVGNFYFIFKTLEEELFSHKEDKYIWCLFIPELLRTKAFEEDLRYFFGDDWSDVVSPSTATKAFLTRLRDVSKEDPFLLIAYCHSFYLGLMAGGQIIKRTIAKSLGLKDNEGLAAFTFRDKPATQLVRQLKDSINAMQIDDEIKKKIISEKAMAYSLTNAIVQEIRLKPSSFFGFIKIIILFLILPVTLACIAVFLLGRSL